MELAQQSDKMNEWMEKFKDHIVEHTIWLEFLLLFGSTCSSSNFIVFVDWELISETYKTHTRQVEP